MTTRVPLMSNELPAHTLWGAPDSGERYAEGIIRVGTPGHGGFILDSERNNQVHEAWRNHAGVYEEDSDWSIVAATFPDLFTEHERERADEILRNWRPHEYTQVTGKVLTLEQSGTLRREHFQAVNKGNYVAVAAEGKGDLVKVTATRGGDRSSSDRKTFMVPRSEYTVGANGFVIDPSRHPELQD